MSISKTSPCPSPRNSLYSSVATRVCPGRRIHWLGAAWEGSAGGSELIWIAANKQEKSKRLPLKHSHPNVYPSFHPQQSGFHNNAYNATSKPGCAFLRTVQGRVQVGVSLGPHTYARAGEHSHTPSLSFPQACTSLLTFAGTQHM